MSAKMNDLNEIAAFVSVVRYGGFTLASHELEEPKSTLSRKVSKLEKRLGTSLLVRTTRSIRLTDAGQKYYDECSRILREMEEAEKLIVPHQQAAEGTVRISAPVEVGTYMLPMVLRDFSEEYPRIHIELDLSDRYVDLMREGFDLALRAGTLKDSSLKAKKIGVSCFGLYASGEYLNKKTIPQTPKEVEVHKCIIFSPEFREFPWVVTRKGKKEKILPVSQISVNSLSMAKNLALAGAGICYIPNNLVAGGLDTKDLISVLPEWSGDPKPYYIVYPPIKIQPLRTRLLIDYLAARLKI
jgi:DNA-binding transcriptional LysR family regulator